METPFELLVQVVQAQGILPGGAVRAEVLVDGVIVGLTERMEIPFSLLEPLEGKSDLCTGQPAAGTATVSWEPEISSFSVPLTSMGSHSLRVNLYREFHGNRKDTAVIGYCQRDRMLSKLWSKVNR